MIFTCYAVLLRKKATYMSHKVFCTNAVLLKKNITYLSHRVFHTYAVLLRRNMTYLSHRVFCTCYAVLLRKKSNLNVPQGVLYLCCANQEKTQLTCPTGCSVLVMLCYSRKFPFVSTSVFPSPPNRCYSTINAILWSVIVCFNTTSTERVKLRFDILV
jgi:hypothetical protein